MLIPRFEAASLTEDRIASLEGDDATSARAGASGVLQDVETALVLGPVVLSTSAADASKLLDVLNIDAIFSSIVQIQDEIVTTGTDLLREAVISLLDRGVAGVVLSVDSTSLSEFKTIFNGIPLDRVGAALRLQDINAPDAVELMKSLNPLVGTYIVTVQGEVSLLEASSETEPTPKAAFVRDLAVSAVKQMSALAQSGRQRRMMLCLPQHKLSAPLVAKLEKMEVGLVGESKDIEFTHAKVSGNQTTPRGIILADSFVACLVTDRSDGLFATVVVDEQGVALGLAYSSQESIREAVRTRQGVYHSRSRGLWYKGLTSGATQMLYRIDVDCDKDALRFTVHQNEPGYCHLNTRTCFGQDKGLTALAAVLQSRKTSAPAGSYTRRLFEDQALLHSKIMEEADELCQATDPDDVAWEAADLIYFALTKAVAAGVGLNEIERHLDMRARKISRRPGNAKPKWQQQAAGASAK